MHAARRIGAASGFASEAGFLEEAQLQPIAHKHAQEYEQSRLRTAPGSQIADEHRECAANCRLARWPADGLITRRIAGDVWLARLSGATIAALSSHYGLT
jgi:hypothetical protein